MDEYSTISLTKALEQISERLEPLEDFRKSLASIANGLAEVCHELELIATVMEMNSDEYQAKKRQAAAERTRWAQEHGQEFTAR